MAHLAHTPQVPRDVVSIPIIAPTRLLTPARIAVVSVLASAKQGGARALALCGLRGVLPALLGTIVLGLQLWL